MTIPTAAGRLPLLGHSIPLLRDRLNFLQELRAYGDAVRIRIGPRRATVVNAPKLIQEMLTSRSGDFSKGALFEELKLFGNDALPVAEGARHMQRRRLLAPPFNHRAQLENWVQQMRGVAEGHLSAWTPGETLDAKHVMQLMAQDVVMAVCLSSHPSRPDAEKILTSVDTVFRTALVRAALPFRPWKRLPTPSNRRLAKAQTTLRTTVADIITSHRDHPDQQDDVVSLLLSATDDAGRPIPEDEVLSEIVGLLAAGSETTAVTLAWLFHELAHRPDLEERLHQEVDTVLSEPLTADSLEKLTFTKNLVNETLRLYSPAWLVTRQALTDTHLGDHALPRGEHMIFSPYAVHRCATLFPSPSSFDPDRWLPERPQPPKYAYLPFGLGKRACLGSTFATTEAVVVTALIAARWRLRPGDEKAVRPVGAITVHPDRLPLTPVLRG